jgi:hypothetical protein
MTYTHDQVEAALCLWEAVLERRSDNAIDAAFERHGAWALRQAVMSMAHHCDDVWLALTDLGNDDRVTFDWEFCPAYVAHCVNWHDCEPLPLHDCVTTLRTALDPILNPKADF